MPLGETSHYQWLNQRGYNTSFLSASQIEELYSQVVGSGGTALPTGVGLYSYNPGAVAAIQANPFIIPQTASQAQSVPPSQQGYSPSNPPPGFRYNYNTGMYEVSSVYTGTTGANVSTTPTTPQGGTTATNNPSSGAGNTTNQTGVASDVVSEFLAGMEEWFSPSTAFSDVTSMSKFGAREVGLVAVPALALLAIVGMMESKRRGRYAS